jgi:hypothetical protein
MSACDRVSLAGSPSASLVASPAVTLAVSLVSCGVMAGMPLAVRGLTTSTRCDICCPRVMWS